jgi:caffeoyl-CoA O-methyltransferase
MKQEWIDYAERYTSDESPLLAELRRHCEDNFEDSRMLSGYFQGRVLSMISHMLRPHNVLEIGTYLGYSALCMAEGLADGGKIISLDVNEETNSVAQRFIERSEHRKRIELLLGDATSMIPQLERPFDLVFIDADKTNYSNYYDLVFPKLRPGGFIIADNVLWSGRVLEQDQDDDTRALTEFNDKVLTDDRVENVLLPIRDGLMVVRKR